MCCRSAPDLQVTALRIYRQWSFSSNAWRDEGCVCFHLQKHKILWKACVLVLMLLRRYRDDSTESQMPFESEAE